MDKVLLQGLWAETVIGVHPWERRLRQRVELDVRLSMDLAKAGRSDALVDTLDYQRIADQLVALIEGSSFQLLEALAEHCAAHLLSTLPVLKVKILVRKPDALEQVDAVAVQITRKRD